MRRLFIMLALAGCASAPRKQARTGADEHRAPADRHCTTQTSLLAAATHKPTGAILALAHDGYVVLWAEQAQRSTLRLLLVDRDAQPSGPSVEVVDSATALTPLDVDLIDNTGYVVGWSEGEEQKIREVDARGRPRGDITKPQSKMTTVPPPGGAPTILTDAEGLKLAFQVCAVE